MTTPPTFVRYLVLVFGLFIYALVVVALAGRYGTNPPAAQLAEIDLLAMIAGSVFLAIGIAAVLEKWE